MADFFKSIEYCLLNEGNWSDDKFDKGGATRFGITTAEAKAHGLDVHTLTRLQAIEIYRTQYWQFDKIKSQQVATKLLDIVINVGPRTGIVLLQRALWGCGQRVGLDGSLGPATTYAVNTADPKQLLTELRVELGQYYQRVVDHDHTQSVFLRGWINRADRIPPVDPSEPVVKHA